MAVCLELFNQIEKNELTWTYVLIYYRQLGCGGYTNRSFGDIEIGSNRGSSYITCTFVIGRGDIKRAVALIWIQDLYLFYYRYWVWSEIITSDYSRTSLYGHPPNTDTSLSRTVFLVRSPCIFSKFNPPNMDTPSTGTLLPPPSPASVHTNGVWLYLTRFSKICLTVQYMLKGSQIMWYCNRPLYLFCFVGHAGQVIILLRTVSFKFRLIHVHMNAYRYIF